MASCPGARSDRNPVSIAFAAGHGERAVILGPILRSLQAGCRHRSPHAVPAAVNAHGGMLQRCPTRPLQHCCRPGLTVPVSIDVDGDRHIAAMVKCRMSLL